MFVIGGHSGGVNTRLVEEYLANFDTWTTSATPLIQSRHLAKAVSVPAHWFNYLPGGCNGIK